MDEAGWTIRDFDLPRERLALAVEFEPFASRWRALGLTDDDLHVLQLLILRDPDAGVVAPGTNGLRKIRFAAPGSGRGKSGGFRIYYLNALEHGCLVLWAVLSKSERADLTKADRNAIAKRVTAVKDYLKARAEGRS